MTKTESVNALRKKVKEGNYEAISTMEIICLYLPRILDYPESETLADINRYNSLIRSNISDKRLQDELVIK